MTDLVPPVIPAEVGIQRGVSWILAFAGMTDFVYATLD